MALQDYILKDLAIYKELEDGSKVLDHVVRPAASRNDIGPVPFGATVVISIRKNGAEILAFEYQVIKEIAEGKVLMCVAAFRFEEQSISREPIPVERIICKDSAFYTKVDGNFILDHIERPRNTQRASIGSFDVGDEAEILISIGPVEVAKLNYAVTEPVLEGSHIMGHGMVDFVEVIMS